MQGVCTATVTMQVDSGDVSSDRLHVLQMDVTSDEQVERCLHYVKQQQKESRASS